MPAVPDWGAAMVLTSPYGNLSINTQTASGIYLLKPDACNFLITVRATTDNVPQGEGSILHHRFLTGTELQLTFQLWETPNLVACEDVLATMLDTLTLHLRGLLNAGDNEGRLSWEIAGGVNRMLDDIRLLVYPDANLSGTVTEVTVTVDSEYPYAEDLTQTLTNVPQGSTVTFNNTGTAIFYPVFQVQPNLIWSITNETTGDAFYWDGGATSFSGYAEIDNFRETIYQNGDETNLKFGINMLRSQFISFVPGNNDITIVGSSMDVLWQAAWG